MNVEDFKEILYQKEENGIVTVTINMPKRKNALSPYTFYELFQAVDVLHFNTTTPEPALADDASSPLSASDHDPLEGRFKFK